MCVCVCAKMVSTNFVIPYSPREHRSRTLQLQDNTLHTAQDSSLMSQLTVESTDTLLAFNSSRK